MGCGRGVCLCCCCFVVIPLLIWISLMIVLAAKTYTPHCYLQDFYIPALNTKLNTTSATFIFFDLDLENAIDTQGVRFRYFNSTLAIYYARKTIANYTLPSFSQGGDETTHLHDVVETLGMPWLDAFAAVSAGSPAAFTVELATTVKVRRDIGRSEEKMLLVRADVEVNSSGERLRNKAIRLV